MILRDISHSQAGLKIHFWLFDKKVSTLCVYFPAGLDTETQNTPGSSQIIMNQFPFSFSLYPQYRCPESFPNIALHVPAIRKAIFQKTRYSSEFDFQAPAVIGLLECFPSPAGQGQNHKIKHSHCRRTCTGENTH